MGDRIDEGGDAIARDPVFVPAAQLTRPLARADTGADPRAECPPEIETEEGAIAGRPLWLAVTRHVGPPVARSEIDPDSVSNRTTLSIRSSATHEQESAHAAEGDSGWPVLHDQRCDGYFK